MADGALPPDVSALVDEVLPGVKAARPDERARAWQEFVSRAQRLPGDGAALAQRELQRRLQARPAVGVGAGRPSRASR